MNKALAIFLFFAGLVTIIRAADIAIQVSDASNALTFTPQLVNATVGDNIVFTWAGTIPHSIVQTDAAKSCVKSATLTDISSGGAFPAPKTLTIPAKTAGKMWYMCGVPGHCAGGMFGTIIVNAAGGAAPPAGGAAPSGATPSGATPSGAAASSPAEGAGASAGAAMPSGSMPAGAAPSSTTASSANRNYYSIFTSGVVFSSMCMAAAYML